MNWQHFWSGFTLGGMFGMLLVMGINRLVGRFYEEKGHAELHHADDLTSGRSSESR